MSVSVNHDTAEKKLQEAWQRTQDLSVSPPAIVAKHIEKVMTATDVTYKYILVTGFLAKCAEPRIHPRALQVSSSLQEAYDARSLCHNVVVSFEKERGNLFGLSNEPFVNKPARHPEHDKDNPQLRNKTLAAHVHHALQWAHHADSEEVFSGLVQILRLGKRRAATRKQAATISRANLERTVQFIRRFLQRANGGARLVAVWGAFTKLLHERAHVTVGAPTQPNSFSGAAGDVEVRVGTGILSAAECKHRPLTAGDVWHGIKKAVDRRVPEYLFVCAAGIASGQLESVQRAIAQGSQLLDVAVIDVFKQLRSLARVLGPLRRGIFGHTVVEVLREMRRPEAADQAAELWNKLIG